MLSKEVKSNQGIHSRVCVDVCAPVHVFIVCAPVSVYLCDCAHTYTFVYMFNVVAHLHTCAMRVT